MINQIIYSILGYVRYRGGVGQSTFIMHRVSGLGTLVFLSLHILLESTAHYAPHLYELISARLRTPFGLSIEIIMAFLVIFHSVNGTRIAYADVLSPKLWAHQIVPQTVRVTWILSFALWLPAAAVMLMHGLHLI